MVCVHLKDCWYFKNFIYKQLLFVSILVKAEYNLLINSYSKGYEIDYPFSILLDNISSGLERTEGYVLYENSR